MCCVFLRKDHTLAQAALQLINGTPKNKNPASYMAENMV